MKTYQNINPAQGRSPSLWSKLRLAVLALAFGLTTTVQAELPRSGYFFLTTKEYERQKALEAADGQTPSFLADRGYFSGQAWKTLPASSGYVFLTTASCEKEGKALEAADGNEGAYIKENGNFTGQMWKAVSAGQGYFYLIPLSAEQNGLVLEGGSGSTPAILRKKADKPAQLWRAFAFSVTTAKAAPTPPTQTTPQTPTTTASATPSSPPTPQMTTTTASTTPPNPSSTNSPSTPTESTRRNSSRAGVAEGLDHLGYPKDGEHHQRTNIPFPTIREQDSFLWNAGPTKIMSFFTPSKEEYSDQKIPGLDISYKERYVERITERPLRLEKGMLLSKPPVVEVRGLWNRVTQTRNPKTAPGPMSYTATTASSSSKSMAHEFSVGLSIGFTTKAAPFGVGGETEVSATVGYALTVESTKEETISSAPTQIIPIGYFCQVWQKEVAMEVNLDCYEMFQRVMDPNDGYENYTAEDAFLITMAESFGPAIWSDDEYPITQRRRDDPNTWSYSYMSADAQVKGGNWITLLKRRLQNAKDIPGSTFPNRWEHLKKEFSYSKFRNIRKVKVKYNHPLPEIFYTQYPED